MSSTMKAAVLTGPKQIEVKEVPVAELRPRDIRIKVSATGVCGSDIHLRYSYVDDRQRLEPEPHGRVLDGTRILRRCHRSRHK